MNIAAKRERERGEIIVRKTILALSRGASAKRSQCQQGSRHSHRAGMNPHQNVTAACHGTPPVVLTGLALWNSLQWPDSHIYVYVSLE